MAKSLLGECHWVTSSRGLVLVRSGHSYIMCNPVTMSFRNLPQMPDVSGLRGWGIINIVGEFNLQVDANGQTYSPPALATWTVCPPDPLLPLEYP